MGVPFPLFNTHKIYETLLQTGFIASAESTVTSVMPDFTCCYVFFLSAKRANSATTMFVMDIITTVLKRILKSGVFLNFINLFFSLPPGFMLIVNYLGLIYGCYNGCT